MRYKIEIKMNKLLEKAKELNIPRRNLMKKEELVQAIKDTTLKYKELIFRSDVVCRDCLNELRKQQKIDEKRHSEMLLKQTIRDLSCEYCSLHTKTVTNGEIIACLDCGLVLEESEANEGDFLSHKIKRR